MMGRCRLPLPLLLTNIEGNMLEVESYMLSSGGSMRNYEHILDFFMVKHVTEQNLQSPRPTFYYLSPENGCYFAMPLTS